MAVCGLEAYLIMISEQAYATWVWHKIPLSLENALVGSGQPTELSKTKIFLLVSKSQYNHVVGYTPFSPWEIISGQFIQIYLMERYPRGCVKLHDHTDNPRLIETVYTA